MIEGNAAGIASRNPEDSEPIPAARLMWDAVTVAALLEKNGLAPWDKNGDKTAAGTTKRLMKIAEDKKLLQVKVEAANAKKSAENLAEIPTQIKEEEPKDSLGLGSDLSEEGEKPTSTN